MFSMTLHGKCVGSTWLADIRGMMAFEMEGLPKRILGIYLSLQFRLGSSSFTA